VLILIIKLPHFRLFLDIHLPSSPGISKNAIKKQAERADKRKKIAARSIVDTILSPTDQGEYIYKDISGGFRAYKRRGQIISVAPQNGYLIVLGSLLTFGGIFGFFVEFRLRKI